MIAHWVSCRASRRSEHARAMELDPPATVFALNGVDQIATDDTDWRGRQCRSSAGSCGHWYGTSRGNSGRRCRRRDGVEGIRDCWLGVGHERSRGRHRHRRVRRVTAVDERIQVRQQHRCFCSVGTRGSEHADEQHRDDRTECGHRVVAQSRARRPYRSGDPPRRSASCISVDDTSRVKNRNAQNAEMRDDCRGKSVELLRVKPKQRTIFIGDKGCRSIFAAESGGGA